MPHDSPPALAFSTWHREAQSFDLPTAVQKSWYPSPSAAANPTVRMNTDAPLRDTHTSVQDAHAQTHSSAQDAPTQSVQTHSSAQDASTQLSWTILPRRRACSKKRSKTPDDSYAGPLSRSSPVNAGRREALPLLCSSRFAGPPGLPPPPSLEVQQHHQVPFDLIPSRAKPPRSPQTQDASTAPAGKHNASPPGYRRENMLSSTTPTAQVSNPFERVLAMSRLAEPKPGWQGTIVDFVSDLTHHQWRLCAPVQPGPSTQEPHADPSGSLRTLSCCYPSGSQGSRAACL